MLPAFRVLQRGWPARLRRGSMPGFRQGQERSSPAPPLPAWTTTPPVGPRASQLATGWPLGPRQVNLPEAVLREGDPGRGPETSNILGLSAFSASRITVLPPLSSTDPQTSHSDFPSYAAPQCEETACAQPGAGWRHSSVRIPLPAPAPGPPLRQWPQAHGARGERTLPPADHPASERGPGRPGRPCLGVGRPRGTCCTRHCLLGSGWGEGAAATARVINTERGAVARGPTCHAEPEHIEGKQKAT